MDRRSAMLAMGGTALLAGLGIPAIAADDDGLVDLTKAAKLITRAERIGRIERLQVQLRKAGIGAVIIEAGSSLDYFTGIQWWRSERVTAVVIPRDGEALIVTPYFEAPSINEMLAVPAQIRTWNEHDNPFAVIADWLRERKLGSGTIGLEETVREFIHAGVESALPAAIVVSAADQIRAVRMRKTAAEIALMQVANTITLNALRYAAKRTQVGMTPGDIVAMIVAATRKQGGDADGGLVLLGEAAAYPHGSRQRQVVREGEVVLMDCGCQVHGYSSDISRTFVVGEPSAELRRVWGIVRQGQQIAHETAQIGVACGAVDDAVRTYYEREGFGPGYKLPGLSHRTGHGIGMDGHEPVNLVHLESTRLDVGMCFSNEPGLYLPGKFGVRLEDCFYMTADGPRLFTELAPGIDKVFG
ncbi:Xaa-Pro peptidase family protein [Novosphingobium sp.]|uniref:M24 family metallopeptidase n=1 Tax=Novosphingobium sp. TaxID=1874826 RepID=UPI0025DF8828|nr:Xaa-Pro peptidase family protein [Novosphingobium sp.]MCC6924291.1 aminopeptidase P family protein [Novosphingobium sp.]